MAARSSSSNPSSPVTARPLLPHQDPRRGDRSPGEDPLAAQGHPLHSSDLRLPRLRDGHAGTGTRSAHPQGATRSEPHRPYSDREVLRRPASVPSIQDLRTRRRRDRAHGHGRLDGPPRLVDRAAGRNDPRPCHERADNTRRRHTHQGLSPGKGRTATGRLWIYTVDERPWVGERAPAALYRYSPDTTAEAVKPASHSI